MTGADSGQEEQELAARSFGDYELIELIAQGGMGVVYKARQKSLNRVVALKTVLFGPQASPDFVKRFQAEAVAAASLQHPNIVAIHEVGIHEGQHFFVMEYVDGPSLAQLVGRQPLPARRAAGYLKTIAEAIHYAHEHGILHRDLKPSNVLIDAQDQPRVTDFGLAKSLSDAQMSSSTQLTLSWEVLGSPSYIPPEQALGKRGQVSRQSDVYALGATLYHLVTGRPPFQGETITEVLQQVLNSEPLAPHLLQPSLPRDLETICLKCLEKEEPRRYQSAQELADDLGRFLENRPIRARPVGAIGKSWKWCRRRPALAAMGAALVLTGALGLAGVVWQWHRAVTGELMARRNAYAGDMLLLQRAVAEHQRDATMFLLNRHRPSRLSSPNARSPGTDLCGWEWRYLWQLCRSDESATLHRSASGIHTLALSKNGQTLAVGGGHGTALWSMPQRKLVTELPVAADRGPLAFSPKENLLAIGTGSIEKAPRVELWSLDTRTITQTLYRNAKVRSLAFSPDGEWLATLDDLGSIAVEAWETGRVVTSFTVAPPRMPGVGVVAFSPNGVWLAIGEDYGPIRLLNLRTGTHARPEAQTTAGVTALAFSSDSELLAAGYGYSSGLIRVWRAPAWDQPRWQFTSQHDNCSGLAFSSDGSRLASAYAEGAIRVWRLADQAEERCLQNLREDLTCFAMLPDDHTLVTGGAGGSLRLWDSLGAKPRPLACTNWAVSLGFNSLATADAPTFARETLGAAARRFGLVFTPDSKSFITPDTNGSLALWDAQSIQMTEPLSALGSNHWGLALSPDGRWLATGNSSGKLTIWDWNARREATNFAMNAEWFGLLHFSPSTNFFVATAVDNAWIGRTRIWRTGQWREVTPANLRSTNTWSAELSPDDRTLAVGYGDGSIRLFDFRTGEPRAAFTHHAAQVNGLLFTPDSRTLVSSSLDRSARIWDVAAGRELTMLHGLVGFAIALTPDGQRLATGGELSGSAVKLWDPIAGREVLSLPGKGEFFAQVVFSPDGNLLAAVSLSGTANLWRAPSWEEVEAADEADLVPPLPISPQDSQ